MQVIRILLTQALFSVVSIAYASAAEPWEVLRQSRAPHAVSIISATRISFDGVTCRLLGVKEPISKEQEEKAKAMIERYLKYSAGYLSVYNSNRPLSEADGTPIVWLIGHSNEEPMSVDLVRLGILEPELEQYIGYYFLLPGKDGDHVADWKGELRTAKQDFIEGKPLDGIRRRIFEIADTKTPNQALLPTTTAVTPAAGQPPRQP